MFGFVKTTVLGGILFLVPIVILIAVIGKAFLLTSQVAAPLAALLPVRSVGNLALVHVLALAILVLICFGAGLAAKTVVARNFVQVLEANVLSKLPFYALLKSKTESVLSAEDSEGMSVVLARLDDYSQIAFEIERADGGQVVVYLPGAPDPWSGTVCIMREDRITPLALPVAVAVRLAKQLGRGSVEALREHLPVHPPAA